MEEVVSTCMKNNLTFAAYRLPGAREVFAVIQKDHRLDYADNLAGCMRRGGFVIAPFAQHGAVRRIIINPDITIRNRASVEQMDELNSISPPVSIDNIDCAAHETPKDEFFQQAQRVIKEIQAGGYSKVVLSRVKCATVGNGFHGSEIFGRLCDLYPDAFVYVFRVKGQCWIGATPEPFLCSEGNRMTTVSLAGTRPYHESNKSVEHWNNKQRLEQEIVTKQIEAILSDFNISDCTKNGPFVKRAGNVLHLCTSFGFPFESVALHLNAFINALHPTAAVCGIPKEKSLTLIKTVESHDREFYAGFLGPVGFDAGLNLFVNLRCMKVFDREVALFVGGGLTSESVVRDEWEETELKAETLLAAVREAS